MRECTTWWSRKVLLGGFVITTANMCEVVELLKLSGCKTGCKAWDASTAALWRDGVVPANAASHCAQPGRAVNDHPFGSWCFCAEELPHSGARAGTPRGAAAYRKH